MLPKALEVVEGHNNVLHIPTDKDDPAPVLQALRQQLKGQMGLDNTWRRPLLQASEEQADVLLGSLGDHGQVDEGRPLRQV